MQRCNCIRGVIMQCGYCIDGYRSVAMVNVAVSSAKATKTRIAK
jgi:hypothetical protein